MRIATSRGLLLAGTMVGGMMMGAPGRAAQATDAPAIDATAVADPALAKPAAAAAPSESANAAVVGADAIVVVGTQAGARDLQFSSNQPIAVLSEDDLRHTAVHNVAEALGLLPGVNVMNTGNSFIGGVDGASRGEGQYVSIRGLNAEYNVNMINGVEVAQGEPYSRQVQLSLLPPSGLNTIVLNKSSTAAMDGDAIGGTVDFRTPNAFDYHQPFYASVTATGRLESRARDYGDSGLGGGAAAELAKRFGGDGQFGVYVSGYYDERHYANSELRGAVSALNDGGWGYLVEDANGNSYPGIDPEKNATQTGIDVGISDGSSKRYGGNISLDWHPDDDTKIYLRGTYARDKTQQNSTLSQYSSSGKSYDQIAGTDRYALDVTGISTRLYYETNPEDDELDTASFGGSKKIGQWTIAPEAFFSYGRNSRPNHIEASARVNQQDDYNNGQLEPLGGLSIGYTNNFPQPLYTSAIYDDLNDAGSRLLARRAGEVTDSESSQTKYGGRLDLSRDFSDVSSILQSISFGGKISTSSRHVTSRDWTNDQFANLLGHGGETWDSLGLTDGSYAHVFPGQYEWSIPKIDKQKLFDYYNQYKTDASLDTCGSLAINNYNCDTQRGSETVYAGYASADLQIGDVQVIPGIRFEHTDIHNVYWVMNADASGELPGAFQSNDTHYNALLPSLFVNYRPSSTLVTRADIWTSYTRPSFFQLGGGASESVGDDGNVTITQGNPNLKPIRAINTDISGEWKFARAGYAMLGAYYKHLDNYLYDAGAGRENSASSAGANNVFINTPENGGSGHVVGLEMQFRKQFVELPGLLGGLGVNIDFTRQWTRVNTGTLGDKPIQNAPNILSNAQIFYEKGGFSFDMIYHYRGSYVESYDYLGQSSWDDRWVRPTTSVDLHVGYDFGHGLKADLSIANLFDNYTYWAHVGKNSLAISDVVDSGRTGLMTVKYSF
ncbi:TonB-dependent receptor [Sphingomonas abietis]|uniref:TonB-dependent receptor n=1 Tax=Sphingomonas abietis TaxID=3012344 RepID=A0ABY7NNA7_9SPHN|nr:TonB-dependent receptor [Sphingomonas abietis]WBO22833.1 TonB-dependent receptor [Sphingomonas abietis]